MLSTMYLIVSDIANPDLFVCCRTWICLDITRFYEEQCLPSRGSTSPTCQKEILNRVPMAGGRVGGSTKCAQQSSMTAVTAPPLVGCVDWSLFHMVSSCILDRLEQTASHAERSIKDCHRMHTRHKHTTCA